MSTEIKAMQAFDVYKVPLRDSNLVEASAGTGKTYSISVLVLRFVLESNIPIQEILMVTFTKSAVAELEHRVRAFIRQAYAIVCQGQNNLEDESMRKIILNATESVGIDEVKKRLKNALLFLDETAIMTIHGFCQKTLGEFAFETDQMFNAATITPIELESVKMDAVNAFWRKHMNGIGPLTLTWLKKLDCTRDQLLELLNSKLNGQVYLHQHVDPVFDSKILEDLERQIQTFNGSHANAILQAQKYFNEHAEMMLKRIASHTHAKKSDAAKYIVNPRALYQYLYHSSKPSQYMFTVFAEVVEWFIPVHEAELVLTQTLKAFKFNVQSKALEEIQEYVQSKLIQKGVITFDDMIEKLHQAVVVKNHKDLHQALRKKYKAVLIDEFQDTDKLQYELFNVMFDKHSVLFYIGDPKQSIYAWRKADINTYFAARNHVRHVYTMNTNYRSSVSVIDGLNHFFKPQDQFDTFAFLQAKDAINYWPVTSSQSADQTLKADWYHQKPIIYTPCKDKSEVSYSLMQDLKQLLTTGTQIKHKGVWRELNPSDICILVRSNKEAEELQIDLRKHRFPAIAIDDSKLSDSPEAKGIYYVLYAVYHIHRANINRALLQDWLGFDESSLLQVNEALLLERFKLYQTLWEQEGVFVMLMQLFSDFNVRERCLSPVFAQGTRVISNLFQLTELLHKHQLTQHFQPLDVLNWFQKLLVDQRQSGDEFEMRIESDEAAITIMTIHKSKGLEFPVIIAPTLNLKPFTSPKIINFRDTKSGLYCFGETVLLNEHQLAEYDLQIEQEHRRLIYVALTRTAQLCYIYDNLNKKGSSLQPFIEHIEKNNSVEVRQSSEKALPNTFVYQSQAHSGKQPSSIVNAFVLKDIYWKKWSYSSLVVEHESMQTLQGTVFDSPYDEWILKLLPKGANTGNLLHLLFERVRFDDPLQWPRLIDQAVKSMPENKRESYALHLMTLMRHLSSVAFKAMTQTFALSNLSMEHQLNELEFDFLINQGKGKAIKALSTAEVVLDVKYSDQLLGVLNGKMDMFFEMNGQYFILDWKSNYLGPHINDYGPSQLQEAMNHNHYHLQYHLYTIAAFKYLKSRVIDFDYDRDFGGIFYVFVRGVREGQSSGIYYAKPSVEKLRVLAKAIGTSI